MHMKHTHTHGRTHVYLACAARSVFALAMGSNGRARGATRFSLTLTDTMYITVVRHAYRYGSRLSHLECMRPFVATRRTTTAAACTQCVGRGQGRGAVCVCASCCVYTNYARSFGQRSSSGMYDWSVLSRYKRRGYIVRRCVRELTSRSRRYTS